MSRLKPLLAAVAALGLVASPALSETLRLLSQAQPQNAQYPAEMAAIDVLKSVDFSIERNEFQVLGLKLDDALRMVGTGAFHVATTQIGSVSKDDPFLEGLDLIGVSTDMATLKSSVDAYRAVFNARLEERFGVTALAIWPFGPQVFLCNQPISSLADLKGKKVRSFTASMSTLLSELGAVPVTLSFPEVYPALQRGVADCGVTSPTSSNTGKWPEVTSHLYPLSVSGSVQAHIVNLDWLNGLEPAKREALIATMKKMEDDLWEVASATNDTALACSTGGDCPEGGIYTAYKMTLVPVSEADKTKVAELTAGKVLGGWASSCEANYAGCTALWNDTVGAARGLKIE